MTATAKLLALLTIAGLGGCAYSGTVGEYSVGGVVSGLSTDSGVLLSDAAGSGVFVSGNGRFSIDNAFPTGAAYDVAVSTDPRTPEIRCTISRGKGLVEGSDVTDVSVDCAPQAFAIGGKVTGLDAIGLILESHAAEVTLSTDGTFVFPSKLTNGSSYAVTIEQQPDGQACTIANGGAGTVNGADVSVTVNCTDTDSDSDGPSEQPEESAANP